MAEHTDAADTTAPHTLLRQLLERRHWQAYRRFRREYNRVAVELDPELVGTHPSEATYRRWVSGRIARVPRAEPCAVLEAMFPGHTVAQLLAPPEPARAGDTEPAAGVLGEHSDLTRSIETLTSLWGQDMHRRDFLREAGAGALAVSALEFLVQPPDRDLMRRGGRQVTRTDVALIRTVSGQAREVDARFGGARYQAALRGFLDGEVSEMLAGSYSDRVGRELLAAAAEATHLLGWMAHDTGRHALAQRYYTHALRLAQAAGDTSQGVDILSLMGYTARDAGEYGEAVRMVRAGVAKGAGTAPAMRAHLHSWEAWTLTALRDRRGVFDAIDNAYRAYDQARPEDDVQGSAAELTRGDLLGVFGHCYIDLGMTREGEEVVAESLRELGDSPRSRSFCLLHAANLAVQRRDAEHAVSHGLAALELMANLGSSRVTDELKGFQANLNALGNTQVIREFHERVRVYELAQA